MAADIRIVDVTDGSLADPGLGGQNVWTGTGIFDKLIFAVNKNIEAQFNLGRIDAGDYATVYLGALQSTLAESIRFVLQEKVSEAQIDQTEAEVDRIKVQIEDIKYMETLKLLELHMRSIIDLYTKKQADDISDKITDKTNLESVYAATLAKLQ